MVDRVQPLADELIALRKQGRAVVYAANVMEAVRVAARLRDLNKAQWFRGEIRKHPKLTPSLYRRSGDAFVQAQKALERFEHWVRSTPGLEELAASTDALLAVAQHYGMPTPFLDFTTDPQVAGYFASVSGNNPPNRGEESCIYCLDIKEADNIWQNLPERYKCPERLEIDASNLWRLEAQKGVFVYCPSNDLNGPFPIDQIVFPYQDPIPAPSNAEIYPPESALEARLREHFQAESILKGSAVFEEICRHMPLRTWVFEGRPFIAEYFSTTPTAHSSWNDVQLKQWLVIDCQKWSDKQRAPALSFEINANRPAHENAAQFEDFVQRRLHDVSTLRQSMLGWRVGVDGWSDLAIDRLNKTIQRVWDEMTRLPWTDEEITRSLSATLKFFLTAEALSQSQDLDSSKLERETSSRLLTQPLRVELGGDGNIHTWAWVDEKDLLGVVRQDFESLLRLESRSRILGNSFNTLMVARTPSLLFDFGKLSTLFAEQMIPTQAVFYPDHPLFPTPARVQVIGPE